MARLLLIAALALLLSGGSLCAQAEPPQSPADQPSADQPAGTGAPAHDVPAEDPIPAEEHEALPIQHYGETDKACLQWSDGCRSCSRGAEGKPAVCSNISIACQPASVTCTGTKDAPASKPQEAPAPK